MKKLNFLHILYVLVFTFSCEVSHSPLEDSFDCNSENNSINFIFKYGVGSKNILNTFDCTFQKDLILDPPVTTHLALTSNELDSINALMQSINFFNYPDTFTVIGGLYSPSHTYIFSVEADTLQKNLFWKDNAWNNSTQQADSLRNLINFIIDIIESKEEYKALPEPRGGYV